MTTQRAAFHLALGATLVLGAWFGIRPVVQRLAYDAAAMAILASMPNLNTQGEGR